mmetsp:Transcript_39284/g.122983  ORF Transcript_39284/g.122983 Transcript_39284/m.122983 type:complete len:255 (+) Transcript_39284:373-1137(+)
MSARSRRTARKASARFAFFNASSPRSETAFSAVTDSLCGTAAAMKPCASVSSSSSSSDSESLMLQTSPGRHLVPGSAPARSCSSAVQRPAQPSAMRCELSGAASVSTRGRQRLESSSGRAPRQTSSAGVAPAAAAASSRTSQFPSVSAAMNASPRASAERRARDTAVCGQTTGTMRGRRLQSASPSVTAGAAEYAASQGAGSRKSRPGPAGAGARIKCPWCACSRSVCSSFTASRSSFSCGVSSGSSSAGSRMR